MSGWVLPYDTCVAPRESGYVRTVSMCPATARNRIQSTDGLVGSQHDWICDGKSLSTACYCGVGHERHEIEWVYKFLVETQESPPIENSANPVDNQHVMVRIPKIWMIQNPAVGVGRAADFCDFSTKSCCVSRARGVAVSATDGPEGKLGRLSRGFAASVAGPSTALHFLPARAKKWRQRETPSRPEAPSHVNSLR